MARLHQGVQSQSSGSGATIQLIRIGVELERSSRPGKELVRTAMLTQTCSEHPMPAAHCTLVAP